MDFVIDQHGAAVVAFIFRKQVPPVRGDIDQRIFRWRIHRAVQSAFEHLVARLAGLERDIVGKDDEAVRLTPDCINNIRQIDQVVLVHLHHTQPLVGIGMKDGLHQRRLAGPARPPEKDIIGRKSGQKLPGILHQHSLSADSIPSRSSRCMTAPPSTAFKMAAHGVPAPDSRICYFPVNWRDSSWEKPLHCGQNPLQLLLKFVIH